MRGHGGGETDERRVEEVELHRGEKGVPIGDVRQDLVDLVEDDPVESAAGIELVHVAGREHERERDARCEREVLTDEVRWCRGTPPGR